MESTTNKKEKDNRLVIILGILLGISIVGNIYLLNRSKTAEGKVIEEHAQVDSLNSFKLALENDFEAMTFELDQFKGKNIQLDSLLEKANNDIAKQKQKIDKLVKENKDIDLLKRQFAEMKAIRDGYRQQIDQLIKENKELRFANINLSQEVDDLNKTKKDLKELYKKGKITKNDYYQKLIECKKKTFYVKPTPPFKEVLDKFEQYRAKCSKKTKSCSI